MKTSLHYQSVKPVAPQPTNKDLLKALGILLALAFITIVVPFGHCFIDYFMNACFK